MTLKKGITEKDGNFKTIIRMQAADLVVNSLVFVDGIPYKIKSTDLGVGILLNNGNFANLVNTGSGGDGMFVPTFLSGANEVLSGNTGVLFTITPPSGERVRIDQCSSETSESNMVLKADGVALISATMDPTPNATGQWQVSSISTGAIINTQTAAGMHDSLIFGIDVIVSLTKTSGNTSGRVNFNFSYGILK